MRHLLPLVDTTASQFGNLLRLTPEERWAIIRDQVDANAESGRRSIWQKFLKFAGMCARRGWRAIPAAPEQIYAYVLFLRAEGRVAVRSLDQYVSAISTVHRWVGIRQFNAHDTITARLRDAWRQHAPGEEYRDTIQAFPASDVFRLIHRGLQASTATTVRPFLSAVLDTIFFLRADSAHEIYNEDLYLTGHILVFRERRFKAKATKELRWRLREFDTRGVPELPLLLRHFRDLRAAQWARRPGAGPLHLLQLPADRRPPTAAAVRGWFGTASAHLPTPNLTHHSTRRTGASSTFSILVPESRIRDWGGWAPESKALWRYIDRQRTPTEFDFRLFGWMVAPADNLRAAIQDVFRGSSSLSPPALGPLPRAALPAAPSGSSPPQPGPSAGPW